MTFVYIIAIILQIAVVVFFFSKGKAKAAAKTAMDEPAHDSTSYEGLRAVSLQVTPVQLKLNIPSSETFVYGIVMDWNTGDLMITLAAYITGAVNLYLSTGERIVGGGANPALGELASIFVSSAREYMHRVVPVAGTSLPERECVRFYLLTNKGTLAAQDQMIYIVNGASPWGHLFEQGNVIMNEIRASAN